MQIHDPRYGNKFPIELSTARYTTTDNISLHGTVMDPDGFNEPWCSYTANPEEQLPEGHICVKSWSEGQGAVEVLQTNGIIEVPAVAYIQCGFVAAPVFKLTPGAIKELGL